MPRRIEIELTSARPDGTWTWRAAGAREPKGVLDGVLLYDGAKAGDVVKAEADFELEGIVITSVVAPKSEVRPEAQRIEIVGPGRPDTPGVTTQLVGRGERRGPASRRPTTTAGGTAARRDGVKGDENAPTGADPDVKAPLPVEVTGTAGRAAMGTLRAMGRGNARSRPVAADRAAAVAAGTGAPLASPATAQEAGPLARMGSAARAAVARHRKRSTETGPRDGA